MRFSMNQLIERFKSDLIKSNLFNKYVIADNNVLAVTVSGSQFIDLATEDSDIDMIVIVDSYNSIYYSKYRLYWNGKLVHIAYRPIQELFQDDKVCYPEINFGSYLGLARLSDNIIYSTDKFTKILEYIDSRSEEISKASISLYSSYMNIEDIVFSLIDFNYWNKSLYYLSLLSFIFLKEEITDEDKENLLKVKLIESKGTTKEVLLYAYSRIFKLYLALKEYNKENTSEDILHAISIDVFNKYQDIILNSDEN